MAIYGRLPSDITFHLIEVSAQVVNVSLHEHMDAVNAFQELKDLTHGRQVRGLINVVRQGLVRLYPLVAQSALNHRIDEQNSCHHHQQPLNTEGFFRKLRCEKAQRCLFRFSAEASSTTRINAGPHESS